MAPLSWHRLFSREAGRPARHTGRGTGHSSSSFGSYGSMVVLINPPNILKGHTFVCPRTTRTDSAAPSYLFTHTACRAVTGLDGRTGEFTLSRTALVQRSPHSAGPRTSEHIRRVQRVLTPVRCVELTSAKPMRGRILLHTHYVGSSDIQTKQLRHRRRAAGALTGPRRPRLLTGGE